MYDLADLIAHWRYFSSPGINRAPMHVANRARIAATLAVEINNAFQRA